MAKRKTSTPTIPSPGTSGSLETRRLKAQITDLRREVRRVEDAWLQSEARMEGLTDAVVQVKPPKLTVSSKHRSTACPVHVVIALADWQCGLSVKSGEIQDYNSYNWDIALRRLNTMLDKVGHWLKLHTSAYDVKEIVCLGLGDLLDGCIHKEQYMYLEFPPPRQAIKAGYALAMVLNKLSAWAPVRYEGLNPDNHARMFKKPMAQGRGEWSYNPIMHEIARAATSANDRVKVIDHHPIKVDVQIGDHTFLIEHGNDVFTWMGIPAYGIKRKANQEARNRAEAGKRPFDYYFFGHWHHYWRDENVVIAPALCGTTPYDHAKGRVSKPGQYVCLVSWRGIFNEMRVDL